VFGAIEPRLSRNRVLQRIDGSFHVVKILPRGGKEVSAEESGNQHSSISESKQPVLGIDSRNTPTISKDAVVAGNIWLHFLMSQTRFFDP
jgi:hypothetical protein